MMLAQELTCPLTLDRLQDPVIASDGFTYEAAAIEDWIRRNPTSPMTGEPLDPSLLIPNRAVKMLLATI